MPTNRLLAVRLDDQVQPVRLLGRDGDLLVMTTDVAYQAELAEVIMQTPDSLQIVVRDDDFTLRPVYGYRIVDDALVLGWWRNENAKTLRVVDHRNFVTGICERGDIFLSHQQCDKTSAYVCWTSEHT